MQWRRRRRTPNTVEVVSVTYDGAQFPLKYFIWRFNRPVTLVGSNDQFLYIVTNDAAPAVNCEQYDATAIRAGHDNVDLNWHLGVRWAITRPDHLTFPGGIWDPYARGYSLEQGLVGQTVIVP